jgi:hypothetical protein
LEESKANKQKILSQMLQEIRSTVDILNINPLVTLKSFGYQDDQTSKFLDSLRRTIEEFNEAFKQFNLLFSREFRPWTILKHPTKPNELATTANFPIYHQMREVSTKYKLLIYNVAGS